MEAVDLRTKLGAVVSFTPCACMASIGMHIDLSWTRFKAKAKMV